MHAEANGAFSVGSKRISPKKPLTLCFCKAAGPITSSVAASSASSMRSSGASMQGKAILTGRYWCDSSSGACCLVLKPVRRPMKTSILRSWGRLRKAGPGTCSQSISAGETGQLRSLEGQLDVEKACSSMVILWPPGPLPILHRLDTNPWLYLVLPLHRQHGRRSTCAGEGHMGIGTSDGQVS